VLSSTPPKSILITGGAGFIGYHVAKTLLEKTAANITLVDNLNDYYEPQLKRNRLKNLSAEQKGEPASRIKFIHQDIADHKGVARIFDAQDFEIVINLAAQAGVRYAAKNPRSYIRSNIDGFSNVIEQASKNNAKLFLYASSSSVYGSNNNVPWKESAVCDSPLSLYAATKISNELMAKAYSHNTALRCIGMRLFNAYGPWGRPDMAYYKWAEALASNQTVELRGDGKVFRDMTYVGDIARSVHALIDTFYDGRRLDDKLQPNHTIFNIGYGKPVNIEEVLMYIADRLGIKPNIKRVPIGPEEAPVTYADNSKLMKAVGYAPQMQFTDGLDEFLQWFQEQKS
jgi:UDP-glucuronate 4-epimerase